jgi:hypothetical protein
MRLLDSTRLQFLGAALRFSPARLVRAVPSTSAAPRRLAPRRRRCGQRRPVMVSIHLPRNQQGAPGYVERRAYRHHSDERITGRLAHARRATTSTGTASLKLDPDTNRGAAVHPTPKFRAQGRSPAYRAFPRRWRGRRTVAQGARLAHRLLPRFACAPSPSRSVDYPIVSVILPEWSRSTK